MKSFLDLLLYLIVKTTNLLKNFFKPFILSILFVVTFFVAPSLAQENTSVDWEKVVFTELDSMDIDNNVVLFVGDECEACDALVTSVEEFDLDTYYNIQIVDGHDEDVKDYLRTHLSEEGFDIDPLYIPVLAHKDFTTMGYSSCSAYLQALDRLKEEEDWLDNVQSVASQVYEEEKAEVENKSIWDVVLGLDWWIIVILIVSILLIIGALVLFIVRRNSLSRRGKVLLTFAQFLFSIAIVVFLVFMANSEKEYIPEESLAGCYFGENGTQGCDTWAELMAVRAQNADTSTKEGRDSVSRAKDLFNVQNVNDIEINTDSRGDAGESKYSVVSDAYDQVVSASEAAARVVGADCTYDSNTGEYGGKSSYTECVNSVIETEELNPDVAEYLSVSDPTKYLEVQAEQLIGDYLVCENTDCTSAEIYDAIAYYNKVQKSNYDEESFDNNGDVISSYSTIVIDPVTGTMITNPIGITVVDDFCEVQGEAQGGNTTTGRLCQCDNGQGGYIYTRVNESWATCDAVCSARNLVCEDCNPEEPKQPSSPTPDNPTAPYCGDGILGNTSGEECEYGDPNGVSCSWNSCSDCTCPEIEDPYCGDGNLDAGEECEIDNPNGYSCTWDNCNHVTCKCVEPGCGDGVLDAGEECERGNPDGLQCLWDEECDQLSCGCKEVDPEPGCGDGNLDSGEQCEEGNPDGVSCQWDTCSKVSCTCPGNPTNPTAPETGIDSVYMKIIGGFVLLITGIIFANYSLSIKDRVLHIRKKNIENNF